MGSGAYIDSSDARLKQHVENLEAVDERLAQLRPVSYEFRRGRFPDRNLPAGRHFGLLAQEVPTQSVASFLRLCIHVEGVFPEVVTTADDGFKHVAYSEFVPLLIRETQLLRQRVQRLVESVVVTMLTSAAAFAALGGAAGTALQAVGSRACDAGCQVPGSTVVDIAVGRSELINEVDGPKEGRKVDNFHRHLN
eukprot:scaffold8081_cov239-Pinguiococcus_pyrenoidosus.AAC.2